MDNRNRPARPRFFIGAAAAIVAAVEGALLLGRKVEAATGPVVHLTQEVMALLSSIAQGVGAILEKLEDIIDAIQGIPGGGGGGAAVHPPNATTIDAQLVSCAFAQPKTFRLPSIDIPDGMELQIKGAPNNRGIVYVARSETKAASIFTSWPLLPNEAIGYKVKNAQEIWIGAQLAPPTVPAQEGVYITVEQD